MTNIIALWREKKKEYQFLWQEGRIISYTKINQPPKGFGSLPYYVALVEFKNGQKKSGQLVLEGKKPKIGAKVKGVLRIIGQPDKEGLIIYGIKFKLI